MPRIRHGEDRKQATRQAAELAAAVALGQSEKGIPRSEVTVLVWGDDKPPRYPAVGLHPGAIDGSVPHLQRRLDHWGTPFMEIVKQVREEREGAAE